MNLEQAKRLLKGHVDLRSVRARTFRPWQRAECFFCSNVGEACRTEGFTGVYMCEFCEGYLIGYKAGSNSRIPSEEVK